VAEQSPLEVLAQMVLEAKVNREAVEEELERTPRWRFRRRTYLERGFYRRLSQEHQLMDLLKRAATKPGASSREPR
jgi:hypothetical protein